jgi:hypothetical protein
VTRFATRDALSSEEFDVAGRDAVVTRRTVEGRLFPSRKFDGGWSISLQGDKAGYQCFPRCAFDTLEEYDAVEAAIYGPFPHTVDIRTLGLPGSITSKFPDIDSGHPCIGGNLNWAEVALIETALASIADIPGAGIPKGVVGWPDLDVYISVEPAIADAMVEYGPCVLANATEALSLFLSIDDAAARDPYAQIIRLGIISDPRVLDLRNEDDRRVFERAGLSDLAPGDLRREASSHAVDGVYFPESGGLLLLSPRMVTDAAYRMEAANDHRPPRSNP